MPKIVKSSDRILRVPSDAIRVQCAGTRRAWSPSDLTGLEMWWDATQIVGYTNGQGVTQWNDLSGNLRHATNQIARAPLYVASGINSLPSLRCVVADDLFLIFPNTVLRDPFWAAAVWTLEADPYDGTVISFNGSPDWPTETGCQQGLFYGRWPNETSEIPAYYSFITRAQYYTYNGNPFAKGHYPELYDTSVKVVLTEFANADFYRPITLNGVYCPPDYIYNGHVSSGYESYIGRGLSALIGEIVVGSGALTNSGRNSLLRYLANKWGQTFASFYPDQQQLIGLTCDQGPGAHYAGEGQSFVAGRSGVIPYVDVQLLANASVVQIKAGTDMEPGTVLGESNFPLTAKGTGDGLNLVGRWFRAIFDPPVAVVAGQTYSLYIPGVADMVYYAGNVYPSGSFYHDNAWDANSDASFVTYVE